MSRWIRGADVAQLEPAHLCLADTSVPQDAEGSLKQRRRRVGGMGCRPFPHLALCGNLRSQRNYPLESRRDIRMPDLGWGNDRSK